MDKKWIKIAIGAALALAVIIASWQAGGRAQERKNKAEISQLKEKLVENEQFMTSQAMKAADLKKELEDVRNNSGFSRDQCATARNVCGFDSGGRRRSTNHSSALHKQRVQHRDRRSEKARRSSRSRSR